MNYENWRHYARGWLLHFLGRKEPAYEAFALAFRADPSDTQAARHLASIAAEQQRFDVAEHWLATLTELMPDDSAGWFNLGFVREQGGHPARAIDAFERSVALNASQDRAWYGKGLAHARLGQHALAAAALDEAVKLQPMNGEAYYQLGMACHHANDPEKVTAVVKKLVGFDPKRAKKLAQEAQRADLLKLIPELPF
jgi:tetratricopeptide (TPR) repeat protein